MRRQGKRVRSRREKKMCRRKMRKNWEVQKDYNKKEDEEWNTRHVHTSFIIVSCTRRWKPM
jgi:hypothetical protein